MVDLTGYRGVTKFRIQGKAVMFGSLAAQSSATPCNPMDCSPPESSVHGLLQTRILEWVTFSLPGDLPDPRVKSVSPLSPALAGRFFTTGPPGKPL